ncbi:methylmalonyl-CoA epimerase [Devosia pacifica]|uniref:Methylmalonyl-CoA epimerase n=1 Tax=Devosia pacifica TaxID=1335967 RepID=A0A918VT55_9HYPH|nr:methylmalonyl-CoA epimerase [Devosia pacifica]GHA20727.1 methylmalonyl-CoA epimerase [Devosia pacifica]
MIGRLHHIGIAVPDIAAASALYRTRLGADIGEPKDLPEHGVTVAFIEAGSASLELLSPLGPDSTLHRFLERHPQGGQHHLCFEVPDIEAAMARLKADGATVLGDGAPRLGAHGLPVIFMHPKDFAGTLVELQQASLEPQS